MFLVAVAYFGGNSNFRGLDGFQNFCIVFCNLAAHVWQARITNFDRVPVKEGMEWVPRGEALI